MKNLTWQNPEQLFVAQVLINKVKSKCCGIKVILVVADGMGGTNAGEVASAIAIETVQNAFTPENLGDIVTQEGIVTSEEAVEEFLSRTVKTADLNIVNASKEDGAVSKLRHIPFFF